MALKAIFLLIINHSFEYPNYYQKLYSLLKLESNIYESKHLFTFFNLLDVSLRSNKISAKTISAFIKVFLFSLFFYFLLYFFFFIRECWELRYFLTLQKFYGIYIFASISSKSLILLKINLFHFFWKKSNSLANG